MHHLVIFCSCFCDRPPVLSRLVSTFRSFHLGLLSAGSLDVLPHLAVVIVLDGICCIENEITLAGNVKILSSIFWRLGLSLCSSCWPRAFCVDHACWP